MDSTLFEHGMNARTSIDLAVRKVYLLDFGCQSGIFSCVLTRFAAPPSIVATFGNLKCLAEQPDRVLLALLCNERKGQSWPREKMPSASDRTSAEYQAYLSSWQAAASTSALCSRGLLAYRDHLLHAFCSEDGSRGCFSLFFISSSLGRNSI
jgi:hypothetical protein